MTLSERLTVGLSHLSVFPKSQCPSGPLGNTAVAQSLLYSGEQSPEIPSLTLGIERGVEGQKPGLQAPRDAVSLGVLSVSHPEPGSPPT